MSYDIFVQLFGLPLDCVNSTSLYFTNICYFVKFDHFLDSDCHVITTELYSSAMKLLIFIIFEYMTPWKND
jgi:hypothetical protein